MYKGKEMCTFGHIKPGEFFKRNGCFYIKVPVSACEECNFYNATIIETDEGLRFKDPIVRAFSFEDYSNVLDYEIDWEEDDEY